MEEFRPVIADTLTLSLFNLKILKTDDFYEERPDGAAAYEPWIDLTPQNTDVTQDPIGWLSASETDAETFDIPEQRMEEQGAPADSRTGKYPVKLTKEAFQKVIEAFEKKLTTSCYYPPAERSLTYGDILLYQAGHYRKVIEGEAAV
jgi:CRISPR-associated protein Cas1